MDQPGIDELLSLQSGVIARQQARDCGATPVDIRRHLRRRDWVRVHAGVYVSHTGPLTWLQRAWAAVLFAWPAALGQESALRAVDGPGKRGPARDPVIHVVVDRQRSTLKLPPGISVRRIAGLRDRVQWNASPLRVRVEEAVLDVAASAHDEFAMVATLADAVQSRRTTATRLRRVLDDRKKYPARALTEDVLGDIAAGTCSVLEREYLRRVERSHGLPAASRQVRDSTRGPLYRDVVHKRFGLVVELDGRLFHDSAGARDADLDRDLDAAVDGLKTARIGWGQAFRRPCWTAVRVGELLRQRGWTGTVTACPDCEAKAAWRSLPRSGVTR